MSKKLVEGFEYRVKLDATCDMVKENNPSPFRGMKVLVIEQGGYSKAGFDTFCKMLAPKEEIIARHVVVDGQESINIADAYNSEHILDDIVEKHGEGYYCDFDSDDLEEIEDEYYFNPNIHLQTLYQIPFDHLDENDDISPYRGLLVCVFDVGGYTEAGYDSFVRLMCSESELAARLTVAHGGLTTEEQVRVSFGEHNFGSDGYTYPRGLYIEFDSKKLLPFTTE